MAVACGFLHTLAVAEEGQVLACGWGVHGRLALGDTQDRLRMTRLAGDFTVRVVMVSTGWGHSALLDSDGELWMSGRGDDGQLGTGGREDMLTPTRVPKGLFGGARVKMAACGSGHTLVLTEVGSVWAHGRGQQGRLGTGDEDDRTTPTFTWGYGSGGALGHGNEDNQLEPREVEAVSWGRALLRRCWCWRRGWRARRRCWSRAVHFIRLRCRGQAPCMLAAVDSMVSSA